MEGVSESGWGVTLSGVIGSGWPGHCCRQFAGCPAITRPASHYHSTMARSAANSSQRCGPMATVVATRCSPSWQGSWREDVTLSWPSSLKRKLYFLNQQYIIGTVMST